MEPAVLLTAVLPQMCHNPVCPVTGISQCLHPAGWRGGPVDLADLVWPLTGCSSSAGSQSVAGWLGGWAAGGG